MMNKKKQILVAMTGASGAVYTQYLLKQLFQVANVKLYFVYSRAAQIVAKEELNWQLTDDIVASGRFLQEFYQDPLEQFTILGIEDWFSPVASGSNNAEQMVICPCTMGTLAAIASGYSNNLIERAADVVLKEGGKLIVVPRETPLSSIHLENLLKLSRMGTVILPPSPGFYHSPACVEDLVLFVTTRIIKMLNLDNPTLKKWSED